MIPPDTTPQAVLDLYLRETVLDPSTAEQYQVCVNLVHKSGLFPTCGLLFTRAGMVAFRDWLRKGRAASTVVAKLRIVRTLWLYLCDEHDWQETPPRASRINPTVPKRLPTAWTQEEFLKIVDAAVQYRPLGHWTGEHWRCLLETLWYSGARIQALLDARLRDLQGIFLVLEAEQDKTQTEKRRELPEALVNAIVRLQRPHGTTLLFPWGASVANLRTHYRKIVEAAGLPCTRRDMFHKVRRSSATAVAALRGPEAARAFLGHPDIRMTVDHYLDPSKTGSVPVVPCLR